MAEKEQLVLKKIYDLGGPTHMDLVPIDRLVKELGMPFRELNAILLDFERKKGWVEGPDEAVQLTPAGVRKKENPGGDTRGGGTTIQVSTEADSREGCDDERFLLTFRRRMLGPSLSRSCPEVLYKLGTSSTICNACTCIFVSFFVTVENKRLVNPTPKRKVLVHTEPRLKFTDPIGLGFLGDSHNPEGLAGRIDQMFEIDLFGSH